ncbi:MAG TPA: MaoC/PaaZ C-terminal domain-containing protein [Patescibacteria group bacterium]|nr:MaoC/PaaZ C-terminal domain-containing protein [Patescibacteria group bacterium]
MAAPTLDAARLSALKVGATAITVDARWLMAYAAALGETDPRYYDTRARVGPLAHPLFPVCYEWPLAQAVRAKAMDETVARRGVHAFHNLVVHRPPRAGEGLRASARVVGVQALRTGTLVVIRFSTTDRTGVAVTTTDHGSIYRGVELRGAEVAPTPSVPPAAGAAAGGVRWEAPVEIPLQMAHVYTECARIYNPIHTDAAVAHAAGLPAIILHGTATLALAVSRVVARDLDGDPGRVRGVAVRFTGMVMLPSRLTVRGHAADARGVGFDALGPEGKPVLVDGRVAR